ncbi:uncharacterized protein LOC114397979 [Glycine soja]|uniref:Uncharacterized protein n=1 Tax=Glycine soja TaxID=3848 RepID=A0A0B2RLV9_GLYSO|nr:uncharacterized protein LOC114397979 [Glycine soja]KHN34165.1 hypothetical protein glysoja_033358 [Glycine soja]RZB46003.1 hypothetical protein D0Y65_050159 [Glycine soja]RZB46004.1 hypothetical protein D0Y65_050159 [Glycine soja]
MMEEMKVSRRVEWWQNMMFPVRRVWFVVAKRLGIRKNGLLKLSNDVRACEYEDIQVMWEILNRNESEFGHSSSTRKGNNKKGHCWKLLRWARCAPCMCRT